MFWTPPPFLVCENYCHKALEMDHSGIKIEVNNESEFPFSKRDAAPFGILKQLFFSLHRVRFLRTLHNTHCAVCGVHSMQCAICSLHTAVFSVCIVQVC